MGKKLGFLRAKKWRREKKKIKRRDDDGGGEKPKAPNCPTKAQQQIQKQKQKPTKKIKVI